MKNLYKIKTIFFIVTELIQVTLSIAFTSFASNSGSLNPIQTVVSSILFSMLAALVMISHRTDSEEQYVGTITSFLISGLLLYGIYQL